MKPFNLEEAKNGAKVCARDGSNVRIICFDRKTEDDCYPIVALVTNEKGNELIEQYDLRGNYITGDTTRIDLMMAPQGGHAWVVIYKLPTEGIISSRIYYSKASADRAAESLENKCLCIKEVEWKE